MPIDPELLETLVCPACHRDVRPQPEGLGCTACGRVYPVRDDVPVMRVEEATPASPPAPGSGPA